MWLQEKAAEECVVASGAIEFTCMYPSLGRFYFEFELYLWKPSAAAFYWCVDNPYFSYATVTIYALLIYLGRKYMATREPFKWRNTMAAWNLLLSIYSLIAALRIGLPVLHFVTSDSFRDTLCEHKEINYGRNSVGFYLTTFVWSKYFELLDTFFIIIHKKPLILLHWYHHISVLVFAWDSAAKKAPAAPIFAAMNASVHFIMYGYYFLTTIKYKGKWMSPMFITIAQISQMVVGTSIAIFTLYYYVTDKSTENPCQINLHNVISAFVMYGSYLALFLQFFISKYILKNKKASFAGKKVN